MQKVPFYSVCLNKNCHEGKDYDMGHAGIEIFSKKNGGDGNGNKIYARERKKIIKAEIFKALQQRSGDDVGIRCLIKKKHTIHR
jgi:hypothetical protein